MSQDNQNETFTKEAKLPEGNETIEKKETGNQSIGNHELLEQILVNTQEVKEAVVKPKKAKQPENTDTKTAKQKAEAKFKRVGTKLNEAGMQRFNDKIESLGINQSQYIKDLIERDLENENQGVMSFDDDVVVTEDMWVIRAKKLRLEVAQEYADEIERLEAEIKQYKGMSLLKRIFAWKN